MRRMRSFCRQSVASVPEPVAGGRVSVAAVREQVCVGQRRVVIIIARNVPRICSRFFHALE